MNTFKLLIVGAIYLTGFFTYHYFDYIDSLKNDTESVVFVDQTDELTTHISGDQITALIDVDNHQWSTHTVWVEAITNYNYDNLNKITLSKAIRVTGNPFKRKREVKHFMEQLDSSLNTLYETNMSISKSCIYEPVMRELNRLSKSKAHHKYMVINSDLAENSEIFSVYRSNDCIELQKHPDKIIEKLRNRIESEDLNGIMVHFVYKPKNDEDNRRFILMVKLYREILESNGAVVSIGTTLIHR